MTARLGALALTLVLAAGCVPAATATPPPGTTTAVATSAPAGTPASPSSSAASPSGTPAVADWPTYHGDAARTGVSTALASFSAVDAAWQTDPLDGDVYAAPIVAGGIAIAATERNSVYAFDARTGAQRWRTTLGAPVDGTTLPCGNIKPVTGITGTPVADANAGVVYVVAFEQPYHHELYAIDLASGAVRFHRTVDPPNLDPKVHQQRPALALANGKVYVAYGGLIGDCGPYRGSIVGASATAADAPLVSYTVPVGRQGGIWAPSGLAVDANGRIYAATGNSDTSGTFDMNDAVLRLSPELTLEDYWAPADWLALSRRDVDIGSIGPTLIPGGMVIEAGKNGYLYLLRANDLGKIGGEVANLKVCAGAYGGFAFADGVAYVPCTDGLAAVQIQGTALRVAWRGPRAASGPPIVAGGAVWLTDPNGGTLYALERATGAVRYQKTLGKMQHFTSAATWGDEILIAADGRLIALRMRS